MPELPTISIEGWARAYTWYGVDFFRASGNQVYGDCPFCLTDGKFYVNVEDGRYECKVCGLSGNLTTFLRVLWKKSSETKTDYSPLIAERPPLTEKTLIYWGVVKSIINGRWLIPGYTSKGEIGSLYSWGRLAGTTKSRLLLPPLDKLESASKGHFPSGCSPAQFDPNCDTVWLCEGFWDGASLWQAFDECGITDSNVVSMPGCNVFKPSWAEYFASKKVILAPHNDHPKEHPPGSGRYVIAGFSGMKKAAGVMYGHKPPPRSVHCLYWGGDGFDGSRQNGFDLRDHFNEEGTCQGAIDSLTRYVREVPATWRDAANKSGTKTRQLESKACNNWKELLSSWQVALKWRRCLTDVLATMLTVCLSTDCGGDQLFLQVIGDPGSAKTRLCDGLLISNKCSPLEHLTGFFSGFQAAGGKDCSLISRVNHKTMVTPEADTIMQQPNFDELMSQMRRIFDGTAGASYKNQTVDKRWTGLRTPWIMAGTPAHMTEKEQSRVGDRFLRICMDRPTGKEENDILDMVIGSAARTMLQEANGAVETHSDKKIVEAQRLTGGYVDYLRENSEELLLSVRYDEAKLKHHVRFLSQFAADLRARPPKTKTDSDASKELPTRLAAQLSRLTLGLAVVTQSYKLNADVLSTVAKVAFDTARGKTMTMCRYLYECGDKGSTLPSVLTVAKVPEERGRQLIYFLREIDVVQPYTVKSPGCNPIVLWRLTPRHRAIWDEVLTFI